jgi:hypothetical protein
MRIIEYKILMTNSISDLINEVNDAIQQGWQPHGSIAINEACAVQPMVKYQVVEKRSY